MVRLILFTLSLGLSSYTKAGKCFDTDTQDEVRASDIVIWAEAINSPTSELARYKEIGKLNAKQKRQYAKLLSLDQWFSVVHYLKRTGTVDRSYYSFPLSVAPLKNIVPGNRYILFLSIDDDGVSLSPCFYIDVSRKSVYRDLKEGTNFESFIEAMNDLPTPQPPYIK